ncbi:MAG: hypothetical protein H6562_17275 [Lewinellaceae bacterium]|nr:hypothetical protein [Lewinellaceae bacterium]
MNYLLFLSPGRATNTAWIQYYCIEDGLSQSYVFCILQDSNGLMWFWY